MNGATPPPRAFLGCARKALPLSRLARCVVSYRRVVSYRLVVSNTARPACSLQTSGTAVCGSTHNAHRNNSTHPKYSRRIF